MTKSFKLERLEGWPEAPAALALLDNPEPNRALGVPLGGHIERYRLIAKGLRMPALLVFCGDGDFGGQVWHVN